MAGRKSKLTPEVVKTICDNIKEGLTYEVSCQLAGISETTFYRWKQTGKDAKSGKFREFWDEIKKAESEAEKKLLSGIRADDSWQSNAWILERRYPERYGKRTVHEHEGKIEHEHSVPDMVRALQKAQKQLESGEK